VLSFGVSRPSNLDCANISGQLEWRAPKEAIAPGAGQYEGIEHLFVSL
jgi:hypothetical protein